MVDAKQAKCANGLLGGSPFFFDRSFTKHVAIVRDSGYNNPKHSISVNATGVMP
jgi:hypothetical protein